MFHILSVNYDNHIPEWRTHLEAIDYHVLVLVREGCVRYTINGAVYWGEAGDFLYIPRSTVRSGENTPGGTHQKQTILFTDNHGTPTGIPFIDEGKFIKFKISNFQYASNRCERLYEEMRESGGYQTLICTGIMQELLGIISRELEKPELAPIKFLYAQEIRSFLLSHYREQIQIGQLADLIGRTPNYATSLFKEAFGCPPIRYMHRLRIMEACHLLLHSDLTVTGISEYLGYYDASYFFRVFKKCCGMSPTEFIARGEQVNLSQLFA